MGHENGEDRSMSVTPERTSHSNSISMRHTPAHWLAQHRLLLMPVCILVCLGFLAGSVLHSEPVPDFSAYQQTETKKQAFFDYISTHAEPVNTRVMADRQHILGLLQDMQGESLSWLERVSLIRISAQYLPAEAAFENDRARLQELLLRVDQVPRSLVLVQAAKESGWGTSRFARQGFNFFGHQCFDPGCGFIPRRRSDGRTHQVARFDSTGSSVRAFVHNLNTHPRYADFRKQRRLLRDAGQPLSGLKLAAGLIGYSERGQAYVNEIRQMIQHNDLE